MKKYSRVQVLPLVQSAVACRLELHASMPGNKDLLYLDLALENVVRAAVERGIGSLGIGAAAFVGPLLQNLVRPLTIPQSPLPPPLFSHPCDCVMGACMQPHPEYLTNTLSQKS